VESVNFGRTAPKIGGDVVEDLFDKLSIKKQFLLTILFWVLAVGGYLLSWFTQTKIIISIIGVGIGMLFSVLGTVSLIYALTNKSKKSKN